MQRVLPVVVLFAFALAGCQVWDRFFEKKVDDPVLGPPPPRDYSKINSSDGKIRTVDAAASAGGIIPAGGPTDSTPLLTSATVVATVNGDAILAGEILEPYRKMLELQSKQSDADEINKIRTMIVKRDLPSVIERRMLLTALRSTLPKENREKIGEFVDRAFGEWVAEEMQKQKVSTRIQLDKKLNKGGTSLAEQRIEFEKVILAQAYLKEKSREKRIGRPEMREYYTAHLDDYREPAAVRWQQIYISQSEGRSKAKAKLAKVLAGLRNGADFADLAEQHSDGPKASGGGLWDWTQKNSLKEEKVDKAIWSLPPGELSNVIETLDAFVVVRAVERRAARIKPFAEVQESIKKKLEAEAKVKAKETVLTELKADAEIRTIFDAAK